MKVYMRINIFNDLKPQSREAMRLMRLVLTGIVARFHVDCTKMTVTEFAAER